LNLTAVTDGQGDQGPIFRTFFPGKIPRKSEFSAEKVLKNRFPKKLRNFDKNSVENHFPRKKMDP
jgi:hypothetical protein